MNVTHQFIQDLIQSGRKLSPDEQVAIREHLAGCPECRAYAAFHNKLTDLLPAVYPPTRHSEREIRARINTVQTRLEKRRWPERVLQNSFSVAGMAMALVLVMVIFIALPRMMPGHPAATPDLPLSALDNTAQPEATASPTTSPTKDSGQPTATSETGQPNPTDEPPSITTPVVGGSASQPPQDLQSAIPAVCVVKNTAYIGSGARLIAVDISQPQAPRLAAQSQELSGTVLKVLPIPADPAPRILASADRYLTMFGTDTPGDLGLLAQSKLPGPILSLMIDLNTHLVYAGGALNSDATKGFVAVLDASAENELKLASTLQFAAPVHNLALYNSVLYVAQNGNWPSVQAITVKKDGSGRAEYDEYGIPSDALVLDQPTYSMSAVGQMLFIGSDRQITAYDLADPLKPKLAWRMDQYKGVSLPGSILGFELRAEQIYITGITSVGQPFNLEVEPPEPIKAATMVDNSSMVTVSSGNMLIAGDSLKIYNILGDSPAKLLATFPITQP